ncbi:TfoX/Sxy family protein [Jatrophihabitans sp. DSM 45814]
MPYDHDLANQLREALQGEQGLTERAMFGGIAFLINGHLAISASSQGGLLLRVDPSQSETLLEQPHAQRFVMRGRQLDGWLRIDGSGLMTDDDVGRWVSIGVKYARSLPQK